MNKLFVRSKNIRGDTIIEVMVALIVLSMVLATVYALSSRSLRAGTQANQRAEALVLAQSQVDLLTNAKNTDPDFAANYQTDQAFCINSDASKNSSAQANDDKLCHGYANTGYNIGVSYSSKASLAGVFVVTAQWPSADSPGGVANLNLYYKLPGVYKKALLTAGSGRAEGLTASINGTVDPNNNAFTNCKFNYAATSPSYDETHFVKCSPEAGAGNNPITVNGSLTGLSPGTTYFFQLCADNLVGPACSANNGTFTTPDTPSILNQSATNTVSPTGTTATLSAQVKPSGTPTTCHFEYGPAGSYSSNVACPTDPGAGNSFKNESVDITGLRLGVTYQFRLVATNTAGTKSGPDSTFNTSLPPAPVLSSFTADSSHLGYGGSTTLHWTTDDNATTCRGSGDGWNPTVGVPPTTNSSPTPNLTNSSYTFYLYCSGPGGNSATRSVTITVDSPPQPPPPPPTAINTGASAIGPTYATLNGFVNANGGHIKDCAFNYGTSTSVGSRISCNVTSITGYTAVNAIPTDLTPRTLYYYQTCASNESGSACSSLSSFSTKAP